MGWKLVEPRSACGSAACRTPPVPGALARSSLTGAWYPTGNSRLYFGGGTSRAMPA
jgi:hypothetical protein